jgi:hypothetical protein
VAAARKSRQSNVDEIDATVNEDEDVFAEEGEDLADDGLEEEIDEDAFEEDEETGGIEQPASLDADDVLEEAADDGDDLEGEGTVAPPPEATFDDESDEKIVAAVTGEDDDEDEIEGLREGEFVCRSCYMAKRDTQLADPEQILCRDCA